MSRAVGLSSDEGQVESSIRRTRTTSLRMDSLPDFEVNRRLDPSSSVKELAKSDRHISVQSLWTQMLTQSGRIVMLGIHGTEKRRKWWNQPAPCRTIPRPNLFLERNYGSGARVDVVLALLFDESETKCRVAKFSVRLVVDACAAPYGRMKSLGWVVSSLLLDCVRLDVHSVTPSRRTCWNLTQANAVLTTVGHVVLRLVD